MLAGYVLLFIESRWAALDDLDLDSLDAAFLRKAQQMRHLSVAVEPQDTGPVILNEAGPGDLERLPGIGPSRSRAILALRDSLGGFTSTSQLLGVRGIGPKTLARMSTHLLLDPPAAADSGGTFTGRENHHGR